MRLNGKRINENFYIVLTTLLGSVILMLYAAQLNVPVIRDETITMANAAWATGRDWSLMIAQLNGAYYRFLQALMTVPFFAWINEPDQIYQASIILQALVQVSTIPVIYLICRRHLRMKSAPLACLIAAAVCFVPSIALYVLYYRGDYLLSVLPWYVLLFFLETVRAAKEEKRLRRMGFTLLAVACSIMAYMAHTRGIVLIIALLISALLVRLLMKQRSLSWPLAVVLMIILFAADDQISGTLKEALYSVSGVHANSFESVSMGSYFNLFSWKTLQSFVMLCLSWLNTLVVSTEGLVLIGGIFAIVIVGRMLMRVQLHASDEEKITAVFSVLVFLGYFAVGALFFKDVYSSLTDGTLTRRVDRLLYDRYSVCGAGMLIFIALYVLCCHRDWFGKKIKTVSFAIAGGLFCIFLWKCLPLVKEYTGYIYNTISLNTFQTISQPAKILSGTYYEAVPLAAACVLGLAMMAAVAAVSSVKKNQMPYMLLIFVLVCDFVLIQVNFVKVRKSSNDYVIEETEEVVTFMQGIDGDIAEEYPYILKGGLSGTGIQFYQSQLMDYRMFGIHQEEQLNPDNFFLISEQGDIDLTWYEDDYYLFDAYDYENAKYDIVYVKGGELAGALEEKGYSMTPYVPDTSE